MGQRVLVVEDSPVIQRLIDMTLKSGGFEVEFSDSGTEGLEMALTCSHDVVILDIGLPGSTAGKSSKRSGPTRPRPRFLSLS